MGVLRGTDGASAPVTVNASTTVLPDYAAQASEPLHSLDLRRPDVDATRNLVTWVRRRRRLSGVPSLVGRERRAHERADHFFSFGFTLVNPILSSNSWNRGS